jgi:hypothetical protein
LFRNLQPQFHDSLVLVLRFDQMLEDSSIFDLSRRRTRQNEGKTKMRCISPHPSGRAMPILLSFKFRYTLGSKLYLHRL